ncbi:AAA family ATPase [Candidatus Amarobacter glycogenicus]|uniref:AAA family ATPase n=1 Tax=Candidatus Amarobacter glycogenicus TaxID=3140699 RepID=UPI0031367ADC|nr:AAA family ATPase [Dehalococcoidia bacterium]
MYIFDLQLTNYRNYVRSAIKLEKGLNLFVGDNAQGKSNLLEAVYLLSTLRSSRASSDSDLVRRDILASDFPVARLSAEVERSAGNLQLDLAIVGRTTDPFPPRGQARPRERCAAQGIRCGRLTCAVLFTTLDIGSWPARR